MNTYSFSDLYPYIFLVALFVLVQFGFKSSKKQSDICFYLLLFFTIFRYNVGWDYETYVYMIESDSLSMDVQRYSYLSRLIFFIANRIHFYPFVFIVFGTLHLSILRIIINKASINPVFSWAIYLLFPPFFLQDLSTIRQAVGLEFIFLAFLFLNERSFKKAFIAYCLAIAFHVSAAYGILLLPLSLKKLPKWVNWALFISSFVLSNVVLSFLQGMTSDNYSFSRALGYLDSDLRKTSLLNYLYYVINSFFLLFYRRLERIDENIWKYIQVGNFGIFTFNVFLFEPTMSTRLCTMYIIVWVLLIPYIPLLFQNKYHYLATAFDKQRWRTINGPAELFVLLPFIALFFFDLMIYVNAYNSGVLDKVSFIPYDFWWNHL